MNSRTTMPAGLQKLSPGSLATDGVYTALAGSDSKEQANAALDPALSEFTMDLDIAGRVLLAERFVKWAKQLTESVAIMRGQQFVQANPKN